MSLNQPSTFHADTIDELEAFYRIGRAGWERPRELRLPMAHSPLMTSRPAPIPSLNIFARVLPSGLPVAMVREMTA